MSITLNESEVGKFLSSAPDKSRSDPEGYGITDHCDCGQEERPEKEEEEKGHRRGEAWREGKRGKEKRDEKEEEEEGEEKMERNVKSVWGQGRGSGHLGGCR